MRTVKTFEFALERVHGLLHHASRRLQLRVRGRQARGARVASTFTREHRFQASLQLVADATQAGSEPVEPVVDAVE